MSLREQLAIARYEVASFREYWKILHQEAMEVRDWEEIIAKGLHTHRVIIETDEYYRDRMARGEAPHHAELDGTGWALITDWTRFSEFVLSHIEPFEASGYEVERADDFRGRLDQTRALMTPPDEIGRLPAWQEVLHRIDEFLARLPEPLAVDIDPGFWASVPVAEVVAALRHHNLAARGLDLDEVVELGDTTRYPGTVLGELQERYWHLQNTAATVK